MNTVSQNNPQEQRSFHFAALVVVLALALTACQSGASGGGNAPVAAPTATNTPMAAPTNTPAPAAAPTSTPIPAAAPTNTPVSSKAAATSGASQAAAVKLVNTTFAPAQLTIKMGTTVVWTSEDDAPHTVTADDGSFDSGNMKKGDSFKFTFTKAGQYPYYCAYHGTAGGGGMAGTITVTN